MYIVLYCVLYSTSNDNFECQSCHSHQKTNDCNADDMTSGNGEDDFEWPREEAERVKLFLPKDCDSCHEKSQSEQRKCVFRFDKDRRLLTVVFESDKEENTFDIIDPNDIVGVNVEIKLIGSSPDRKVSEPRSVASCDTTNDSDPLSQNHEEGQTFPMNRKSTANNEPVSEVPVDTQATAVFSLFVYPKQKTRMKKSILSFCGNERNNSKTTKTEIIFQEEIDRQQECSDTSKPFKNLGHRYEHHRRFTVAPTEDFTDLSILVSAIRKLSRPIPSLKTEATSSDDDEERLLVIVNPFSGEKMGVHKYDTILLPMLEQAGIAHDCLITTHPRHAEERMRKQCSTSDFKDVSEYTGIVLVGGDGIIHEIMQGIHHRGDRDKILGKIKLGTIGAGTSNGYSASLAHASKVGA